ncbi:hypothetical protein Tco_1128996, partial [Tanacetum coccineum]
MLLVENLNGLVDKIKSSALDDVLSGLTTAEHQAAHALMLELARGFDYVNSDSDTSSKEPIVRVIVLKRVYYGCSFIEDSGWLQLKTVILDHCPKKVSITSFVDNLIVEKINDGFQTVGKKKKKGKSKAINGGQFDGHSVKHNVRYEPKAIANVPKNGATNVGNASKSGLSQVSSLRKNQPLKAIVPPTKEDYSLWEVIENGNSFKPQVRTTANTDGTSTSVIPGPVTIEEKTQKRNDVKDRSMLLMALPNEHMLTFNQYPYAKTLFAVIQSRFGGNEATRKTQKTLLKQMYENFNAPSTESLYSIFNRLQKNFWRNKPDLETMSFDDLYNNFKIVEQEVKRAGSLSSNSGSQNMTFVSTPDISTARTQDNTAGLSDATIYAFIANQPNGSQLVHEYLEQLHDDDLEEMDLKWQLAILKEEVSTNMAIMAFSDSKVYTNKTCSNTYLKSFETLKSQLDNLRVEFNKSEFDLVTYKRGLASVEEQLVFYKKNEVILTDQIVVLKRDASFKDSKINDLKLEIEKLKNEKESNQIKIDKFKNASKTLDKLIGCQVTGNSRKGVGYNVVPPPPTGLFTPLTIDLSYSSLEEFKEPEFEGYGHKASKSVCVDTSNEIKKTPNTPLVKELVKQTTIPTSAKIDFVKPKQQEEPIRKTV